MGSTRTGSDQHAAARPVATRIPWQAESDLVDSHARSYMPVSLYQSRLRMLAAPTVRGSVLALQCGRSLAKMLRGKERIYDVRSTRAAQRDATRFVASRYLLRSIDAWVQQALEQSLAALNQLSGLPRKYNGCFMLLEQWPALADFDQMLDRLEQFSRPYLQWIVLVRQASPQTQMALRAYLDSEFHLRAIAEDPAALRAAIDDAIEEPREVGDAHKHFEHISKTISSSVRRLVDLRSQLFEATRFAFEESRVGRGNDTRPYAAWPFPLRLRGSEDGETLAASVASYQVLGRWMLESGSSLSFAQADPDLPVVGQSGSSAGQEEAQSCWRAVHEAGEALIFLGAALHALVRVESAPHCQLCYRHVGLGLRKYCQCHARPDDGFFRRDPPALLSTGTVHVRTQHRQSVLLAEHFKRQFEQLDTALVRKPIWRKPTAAIELALSRGRRGSDRNPHEWGSTGAQRAQDIQATVDCLRPVLGALLHQRMSALQTAVAEWVDSDISEQARRMESLTLGGFFAHWFSGFSQRLGEKLLTHQGTDETHPMTAWNLVPSGKFNAPLRRISPLNLDSIVRDLLLHRAWVEVGGEQADAALRLGGAPVPGLKVKGKVDLVLARRMRDDEGMSFEAIGARFGVSRAAVYLALKRARAAAS